MRSREVHQLAKAMQLVNGKAGPRERDAQSSLVLSLA